MPDNAGRSYRESAVRGASPVELVVRLYEQVIEDLRQAINAIEQQDIETRGNKVNHAILVLGCLQSQLSFQSGGKVARDLERFYDQLRQNLIQAQISVSKPLLLQQITDLLTVREAWMEVQHAENSVAQAPAAISEEASTPDSAQSHVDWKA